jgi:hypothetical protein
VDEARAFGRPIEELTASRLADYCALYNIVYAVTKSDTLTAQFRAMGSEVTAFGSLHVFAISPRHLPGLWEGNYSGEVEGGPNRVSIRHAPSGRVVLNYHYFRTMVAPEGTELSACYLLDDPVPFIQVDNTSGLETIEVRVP